jgi:hypothetical protein
MHFHKLCHNKPEREGVSTAIRSSYSKGSEDSGRIPFTNEHTIVALCMFECFLSLPKPISGYHPFPHAACQSLWAGGRTTYSCFQDPWIDFVQPNAYLNNIPIVVSGMRIRKMRSIIIKPKFHTFVFSICKHGLYGTICKAPKSLCIHCAQ